MPWLESAGDFAPITSGGFDVALHAARTSGSNATENSRYMGVDPHMSSESRTNAGAVLESQDVR